MALNGVWRNELGSTMTLVDEGNGGFTGTYVTAVGDPDAPCTLAGRYDTQPNDTGVMAIGWTVVWQVGTNNAHSVTTWSGLFHDFDGVIAATWLLTSEATLPNAWADTQVGQDQFTPTGQAPAKALAPAASHPTAAG
jgi:hypothetical protein